MSSIMGDIRENISGEIRRPRVRVVSPVLSPRREAVVIEDESEIKEEPTTPEEEEPTTPEEEDLTTPEEEELPEELPEEEVPILRDEPERTIRTSNITLMNETSPPMENVGGIEIPVLRLEGTVVEAVKRINLPQTNVRIISSPKHLPSPISSTNEIGRMIPSGMVTVDEDKLRRTMENARGANTYSVVELNIIAKEQGAKLKSKKKTEKAKELMERLYGPS